MQDVPAAELSQAMFDMRSIRGQGTSAIMSSTKRRYEN